MRVVVPQQLLGSLIVALLFIGVVRGQEDDPARTYAIGSFQILSYGRIPTWIGMASGWQGKSPRIHLYNPAVYRGHAEFAAIGLKTGLSFRQFKQKVAAPSNREFLPFFIYDIRKTPIDVDGRRRSWALRLEDYEYGDTDEELQATCRRLFEAVAEQVHPGEKGKDGTGLLVLAKRGKVRPNESIAPGLRRVGIPSIDLSKLLARSGARRLEVLNPGVAVGWLRFIAAGDEDKYRPDQDDIAIFEALPRHVPPLAGIITLEPQTPLSHINLLAINRGTLNLYVLGLDALPGAQGHVDKLVRIDCTEGRVIVGDGTTADLDRAKRLRSRTAVAMPVPDRVPSGILELGNADMRLLSPSAIGSKASNYARIEAWFPKHVRPGFALPVRYYLETIENGPAATQIANLNRDRTALTGNELERRLALVRQAIQASRVPPGVINSLRKLIDIRLPGRRIRLRSSTTCEDLPDFNGAGLYESVGIDAQPTDVDLERALLRVYASVWNSAAFAEREYYGLDHTQVAMAILINEAFRSERANGVVVTIPGKDGSITVLVNAQPGENEVTNPARGAVPESLRLSDGNSSRKGNSSESRIEVLSHSNVGDVFIGSEKLAPVLEELRSLSVDLHHRMTKGLATASGHSYGIDIEFRLIDEAGGTHIYIKQSRLLKAPVPH